MFATRFNRFLVLLCAILACSLAACSADNSQLEQQLPSQLGVTFATEPTSPVAGETTELVTSLEGLAADEKVQLDLEIKLADDQREVIRAEQQEPGRFVVPYVFQEAGSYQVIIHIYTSQLHQMESVDVTVTE